MALSLLASRAAGPLSSLRKFFANASLPCLRLDAPESRDAQFEALNDRIVPANFSLNGSTLNVTLFQDESVSLTATGIQQAADGAQLTLSGTLWSGEDMPPIVVGKGQQTLNFANNDTDVTKVNIIGLGNNSFNFGAAAVGFDSSLSIDFTNGNKITNDGEFIFDDDELNIVADGVSVTQQAGGTMDFGGTITVDLGMDGDLLLDVEENDFRGNKFVIVNADDVAVASNGGVIESDIVVDGKISGDLTATLLGAQLLSDIRIGENSPTFVGGETTLTTGANLLGLIFAEGDFVGPVNAYSKVTLAIGAVQIIDEGDLVLGEIDVDSPFFGSFIDLSGTSISQMGKLTIEPGSTGPFDPLFPTRVILSSSTGAGDIVLDNAENDFNGETVFLASQASNVSLRSLGDLSFDADNKLVIEDLTLVGEKSVDATDSPLTVFGLTSVEAGEDVLLDNGGNQLTALEVVQTDVDSVVNVVDTNSLTFFGEVAGKVSVETTGLLSLGGQGPLILAADKGGEFKGLTIDVLDAAVSFGTGATSLDVTTDQPVTVSSKDGLPILLVFEGGTVEAPDGIAVGTGAAIAGDGTYDVGAAGVSIAEGGAILATSVVPEPIFDFSIGSLAIMGDLSMSPLSFYGQDIAGTGEGEFDTVSVSAEADITGSELIIDLGPSYVAEIGDSFTILTAAILTGNFGNLDESGQITVDGVTFQVTTTDTTVDLEVVAITPPVPVDGIGVYRPSAAEFVFNTSNVFDFDANEFFTIGFGVVGDQGFVGDFTGDGMINVAVYRDNGPNDPGFFIINTSPISIDLFDPLAFVTTPVIGNGDEVPFAGDWDGDGDDDLGLYRNADSNFATINLAEIAPGQTGEVALGIVRNIVFGNPSSPTNPTDPPAVGNFNDSFVADQIGFGAQGTLDMADVDIASLPAGDSDVFAFFNPDPFVFGTTGDQQLNGNYSGDESGLDQRSVHRSSTATFSIASDTDVNLVFGLVGDQGLTGNWVGLPLPLVPATEEGMIDSFFSDDEEEG
ncbi:hypothetical protein Pan216_54440 [Planctomycetes bacterium Pan216]|uniref:Uncharacterized protein n=1 Tax=Kolteria novifilia TaxID=2527975 RepID=A0A518BC41_9BACT|nr:hypothetical protein Pan216_54440 [Planctomycetes bacterium Pan216]